MYAPLNRLALLLLVAIAPASCGRVGYDLVDVREQRARGRPDASSSGPDSGTMGDGGQGGSSSGGRVGTGGLASGGLGNGGQGFSGSPAGGASSAAADGGSSDSGGPASGGTSSIPPDAGGRAGSVASDDAGIVGCADGQREGFLDTAAYPDIAACAGGFALPGVVGLSAPACGRTAGDDGATPDGTGCNALDLCALGFHICSSAAEVSLKSSTGCTGAAVGTDPEFFITAQPGGGSRDCASTGSDDVFGCGTLGARPVNGSNCAPLDKWSTNLCAALTAPWACGSDPTAEGSHVEKPGPSAGGVLCCHD